MNRRTFGKASGALALSLSFGIRHRSTSAQAAYSAQDIGAPEGFDSVVPVDMNANGVVVVQASSSEAAGLYLYSDGKFQQLGDGSEHAHGHSINEANNVAGWLEVPGEDNDPATEEPVLLAPDSQAAMPGDNLIGRVYAVDTDGRAVGEAQIDSKATNRIAVQWSDQDVSELKGTPDGATSSALATNSLGQIAGWIETTTDDQAIRKAVLFSTDKDPTELGTIGGTLSEAVALNEQGQVAGNSTTADGQLDLAGEGATGFIWADGAQAALPPLEGQGWSNVHDLNNFGLACGLAGVGGTPAAGVTTTAVVWAPDTTFDLNLVTDLPDGITLTDAVAINDLGQVLCSGIDNAGKSHAIILTVLGN